MLFAHPSFPAKSVAELVALARSKPKSVQYGTPGVASLGHLTLEVLQSASGARLTHVPYKGPAAVVTAVLGGEIPIGIGASPAVLPMVQAKRVVALGVTSLNRLGAARDTDDRGIRIPGIPGHEQPRHSGARGNACADRRRRSTRRFRACLPLRTRRARLQSQGVEPAGSTPEEFGNIVKAELARWTRVISEARISVGP